MLVELSGIEPLTSAVRLRMPIPESLFFSGLLESNGYRKAG